MLMRERPTDAIERNAVIDSDLFTRWRSRHQTPRREARCADAHTITERNKILVRNVQ